MFLNYSRITFIVLLLNIWSSIYSQNTDAILLNRNTEITMKKGILVRYQNNEIQINNRAGEKFCKVYIPYSKMEKVNDVKAYIEDKSGKIIKKLQNSDIKRHSAISDISLYEDNMVMEFTLKHNDYPYKLCYSYQETATEYLNIDYWIPVLDMDVPTIHADLKLTIPFDFRIRFKTKNKVEAKIDTSLVDITYNWTTSYVPIDDDEIFSPDIQDYLPLVEIIPLRFKFKDEGSFENWMTYGNWQYTINEKLMKLPENEIGKINLLINGITDKREKIRILYHYLQDETRYINVSIKTGGMVPYPAQYVAENKYGDCKALSNYFRSVLRAAGINSYYTKVYAGDEIREMDKTFPSQQSNHIILCVPLENDTIWLDCTSDGPFNYQGTFTQGRDALLIDKDSTHFTKTPTLKPADVTEIRRIKINQGEDNKTTLSYTNTYRGEKFELLSQLLKGYTTDQQNLYLRNNFIEKGIDPLNFKISTLHRDSMLINLNYEATTNKVFKNYGNELLLLVLPFDIPKFEKPAERKLPVKIDFPIQKIDSQTYIFKDKYRFQKTVDDENIISEFGTYTSKTMIKGNEVEIIKSFTLHSGCCTNNNYPKFYDFVNKVIETEKKNAVILTIK